jgi:hypothetical protein
MAVWRAVGDETTFQRAGTAFGLLEFQKTSDGFFALSSHSREASGSFVIYRFEGHDMKEVAALAVGVGGAACALTRGQLLDGSDWRAGLVAAHIDPDTAERHFCSEPWAKR